MPRFGTLLRLLVWHRFPDWPGDEGPEPTIQDVKAWFVQHGREQSGVHLGTVRRWIQHTYINGDTVTWGSREDLRGPPMTPARLEALAQEIREAVVEELGQDLLRAMERVCRPTQPGL